jgi:FkbM family methyltransferase
MQTSRTSLPQLVAHWSRELWIRYYFKFVLPRMTTATVDGIQLDLSRLSLKARNRIVNVGYESQEKELCRQFLTKSDSVLELGSGIGFIGLFCRLHLGIQHYVSVEANPHTVEILQRNYTLNGLQPRVFHAAVGPAIGTVKLNVGGDFWENSVSSHAGPGLHETMTVPCETIEALLGRCTPPPNVLIVDVEGAENELPLDALPRRIEKILIELHPHIIGEAATKRICDSLQEAGFCLAATEENSFAFIRPGAPSVAGGDGLTHQSSSTGL